MNRAVAWKTFRDARGLLLALFLGAVVFEAVLMRSLGELPSEASGMLSWPPVRRMISTLLGADLSTALNSTTLVTVGLGSPLLYALLWTFLLTTCTRITVGEIDRGTADLLLTLPVPRAAVYATGTLVWLLLAALLCAAVLGGVWVGIRLWPLSHPVQFGQLVPVIVNLFALCAAIGSLTMFVGSLVSRRGSALAIVLAILLASFFLNFLLTIWSEVRPAARFGILYYYRPLPTVRDAVWPLRDLLVLTAIAAVTWLAGWWRFTRRDIPAA